MKVGTTALCVILLCIELNGLAQVRTNLVLDIAGSDLVVKEIPSYIDVNGSYQLATEGVRVESKPSLAFSLGAEFQKRIGSSWNLYGGVKLNYRRAHMTYYNDNLFFFDRGEPFAKHTFSADLKHDLINFQIPVGVMIPIYSKFYLDVSVVNNLVIKTYKHEEASDPSFQYLLVSLDRRATNAILVELALGATYQTNDYTLRINYVRAITPLESKTSNAYNHLIPADLYFSGINLSMQIRMQALFSSKTK